MKVQAIRHATAIITLGEKKILLDPIFSPKGTLTPIPDVPNQNYNPLVDLPIAIDEIINVDAVLITHTHKDHFDDAAADILPKHLPMLCQPEDKEKLLGKGFENVLEVRDSVQWEDIKIYRTGGKHGHDEIAIKMAPVSGFFIAKEGEPSLYITGDTVWCSEVEKAIEQYNPEIIICYAGSAQFSYGRPITLNCDDIYKIYKAAPSSKIIAIHMEAWNHCRLSRSELKCYAENNGFANQILIPADGELLDFEADDIIIR